MRKYWFSIQMNQSDRVVLHGYKLVLNAKNHKDGKIPTWSC
jgi:hypothetical protein